MVLYFILQATPEVIYQRIKHEKHRPLLKVPDPLGCIKELYQQRLPLYDQADYTIDANDASIEGPVVEILKKYRIPSLIRGRYHDRTRSFACFERCA